MKKVIFGLFFCISLIFILSCKESTDEANSPKKSSYEIFSEQKAAWSEPANYSFQYEYAYGDSEVGAEFVTIVTDGSGICTANEFAGGGTWTEDEEDFSIPHVFKSISALYDYFEKVMLENPAGNKGDYFVSYSNSYKNENGVTYPQWLDQTIGPTAPDSCGYGGDSFHITKFSLENHKTFSAKKSAWEEPEGAYSFNYFIYYSYDRIGPYAFFMTTTVDEKGNGSAIVRNDAGKEELYQKSFDSFKEKYGDVALFGSGDDFGKFNSISEIYDLIEKIWTEEEKKAGSNKGYGIAPFFKAQDSYGNLKIPYDFEYTNFSTGRTSSSDSLSSESDDEIKYMRIEISVRNFALD